MRHFISFQKKKALHLESGTGENSHLAHELNHELMAVGYVLGKRAFDAVAKLATDQIDELYGDLITGIRSVIGNSGYEPIYRNFPQSVLKLSYESFVINALLHYWTHGNWRPNDAEHLQREFRLEPVKLKEIGVLTQTQFTRIFEDLLYGEVSLSSFDKSCVDWHLDNGGDVQFSQISFKETASYVGQRMVESGRSVLPTRQATTVLRIWAAYSGGDEGLKTNTKFKNPSTTQRALLLSTLDGCTDLEESFKSNREKWLRMLFYLHPLVDKNRKAYPRLADHVDRLRNHPKTLRTFNSKVEGLMTAKDPALFKLLATRPGAYMRRLDHLVRTFGIEAFYPWLELDLAFAQLVTAYNHFSGRATSQAGRGAVLAGQGKSEFATYKALAPLPQATVEHIKDLLMKRLKSFSVDELACPVHVERGLYYTPLATNNRASTLTLDSKVIGATKKYTEKETLRLFVHWEGRSDIDLSGFAISRDNEVLKVGWNASHHAGSYMVYSGDNTGLSAKNAEYLDINTSTIPPDIEWIIVEARIFSGPDNFAGYKGTVHMGWMSRKHPEANKHWLPKTIKHAMVVSNEANVAYLMAFHPESNEIVFLDMSMGRGNVSTPQDAMRMRLFLESFVTIETSHDGPSWDRLNQGHILELLAGKVASDPQSAEVAFDEHTTAEQVSRLMTLANSG